jgi:hypothetical protein
MDQERHPLLDRTHCSVTPIQLFWVPQHHRRRRMSGKACNTHRIGLAFTVMLLTCAHEVIGPRPILLQCMSQLLALRVIA